MAIDEKLLPIGATNPLQEAIENNKERELLEAAKLDLWRVRLKSTAYAVGDIVIIPGQGNFNRLLECTTAGTTGSGEITQATYNGYALGAVITDGSVKWTVIPRDRTSDPGTGNVTAVNGKDGDVTLNAADVSAEPAGSIDAHNKATNPHPGKFEALGAVFAHNTAPTAHAGMFETSGSIATHNASQTAHSEIMSKKANLDSPAFSGVPTAPTANIGTSDDQIASTRFVHNSIDNMDFSFSILDNGSGYQKLPSGLIIQWGKTEHHNKGPYSFPIPFPHACLSIAMAGTTAWNRGQLLTLVSKEQFKVQAEVAHETSWIAIGY